MPDVVGGVQDVAGVVLAGGRSSRMGTAKADLEWHGSTLLYRTAALLARTVEGPVIVVAAPGQQLPDLPAGVAVVTDPVAGVGPMQGIATGLAALAATVPAAFVCSTDLPFLHPAFIRRVLRELDRPGTDVALPFALGFRQPLAAGYRTVLAEQITSLIAQGKSRPGMLHEHCAVAVVEEPDLLADADVARLDPHLDSVVNVNAPGDYAAARARPSAEIVVECFGVLAGLGRRGPHPVRAATFGEAAAGVGLDLDRHVVAALNGDRISSDPWAPLVAGDAVAFLSADAGG